MPRIKAYRKKYKLIDLQGWIISQMHAQGFKQSQVADALGISQPALSDRLKPPKDEREAKKKDPFGLDAMLRAFQQIHKEHHFNKCENHIFVFVYKRKYHELVPQNTATLSTNAFRFALLTGSISLLIKPTSAKFT